MKNFSELWFLVLIIASLYSRSFAMTSNSSDVTVVAVMCELSSSNDLKFIRKESNLNGMSRQYNHVLTLMKSLVISWRHSKYTRASGRLPGSAKGILNVVIFADNTRVTESLSAAVSSWDTKYTSFLNLTFRQPTYPPGLEWLRNMYAPCATLRILLPEMMKDHSNVLYVDTDIIFFQDPRFLWDLFSSFNHTTVLASRTSMLKFRDRHDDEDLLKSMPLPTDQLHRGVHSGTLLMDLAAWRRTNFSAWLSTMKPYQERLWRFPDEILLNTFLLKYPAEAQTISFDCSWNTILVSGYRCRPLNTLSILEGNRGLFMKRGLSQTVYKQYESARLDETFSIKLFVRNMKKLFPKPLVVPKDMKLYVKGQFKNVAHSLIRRAISQMLL